MRKKVARMWWSLRMRSIVGAVSGKGPSSKVNVTKRCPSFGACAGPFATSHARDDVSSGLS